MRRRGDSEGKSMGAESTHHLDRKSQVVAQLGHFTRARSAAMHDALAHARERIPRALHISGLATDHEGQGAGLSACSQATTTITPMINRQTLGRRCTA